MFATTCVMLIALGLCGFLFAAVAFSLRTGLHWWQVEKVTTQKVFVAAVAIFITGVTASLAVRIVTEPARDVQKLAVVMIGLSLPCLIIRRVFRTSLGSSFLIWLLTISGPAIAVGPIIVFLLEPFVIQVYSIPTNSMAPTILGTHCVGECPQCGEMCYRSVPFDGAPFPDLLAICDNFHEQDVADFDQTVYDGDRIVSLPWMSPRRWDLVAFKLPKDPTITYVKRVVGLPGETIEIRDAAIWADGRKLVTPPRLVDIRYSTDMGGPVVWGSPDYPADLGGDEYFVLGDFQGRSADARIWEVGDSDRRPYAVPASHLQGVVTHVLWPPARSRILR